MRGPPRIDDDPRAGRELVKRKPHKLSQTPAEPVANDRLAQRARSGEAEFWPGVRFARKDKGGEQGK